MSLYDSIRALTLLIAFVALPANAQQGSYILGAGAQGDSSDGLAATVFGDVAVSDKTWLSASFGRNAVDLPRGLEIETLYGDVGVDFYFDPAGLRLAVAYWGDSEILDSVDFRMSMYSRGDGRFLSLDFDYRDFEFELPEVGLLPTRKIPFHAAGYGLSGRFDVGERVRLHGSAKRYEYNVNLRVEDTDRITDLLSISRLSLLSSLIDWRVSGGIGLEFGLRELNLDLSRWRGSIDGGENHSVTLRFLTPISDRADIEVSLGRDSSELYGDVTVGSIFFYFYGGN